MRASWCLSLAGDVDAIFDSNIVVSWRLTIRKQDFSREPRPNNTGVRRLLHAITKHGPLKKMCVPAEIMRPGILIDRSNCKSVTRRRRMVGNGVSAPRSARGSLRCQFIKWLI